MHRPARTTGRAALARAASSASSSTISAGTRLDNETLDLTSSLAALLGQGPVAIACQPNAESIMGAVGLTYLAHARQDDVRLTLRQDCQPRLGEAVLLMFTRNCP